MAQDQNKLDLALVDLIVHNRNVRVQDVRDLLDAGANPNARDRGGDPILYMAAFMNMLDLATLLLARGADASASGPHGVPLHGAFHDGSMSLQSLIYSHAPNVWDVRNRWGQTPMDVARASSLLTLTHARFLRSLTQ